MPVPPAATYGSIILAITQAAIAMVLVTERSIPPTSSTMVMPMLTTPTMEACRSILVIFLNVGKIGDMMLAITNRIISAMYGPLTGLFSILFTIPDPLFSFMFVLSPL